MFSDVCMMLRLYMLWKHNQWTPILKRTEAKVKSCCYIKTVDTVPLKCEWRAPQALASTLKSEPIEIFKSRNFNKSVMGELYDLYPLLICMKFGTLQCITLCKYAENFAWIYLLTKYTFNMFLQNDKNEFRIPYTKIMLLSDSWEKFDVFWEKWGASLSHETRW